MALLLASQIRKKYTGIEIPKQKDPFVLFKNWFKEAQKFSKNEPNAMVLSTIDQRSRPRSRFVLLKHFDNNGFCFFTNQQSRKGKELKNRAYASLLFYWPELHRQVRIEGKIILLSKKKTEEYFDSRPKGSQIAAFVSAQSLPLASRKKLLQEYNNAEIKFKNQKVPLPEHWAGYCLIPDYFEFWSGMPSRLHDRVEYTKGKTNRWNKQRLYP